MLFGRMKQAPSEPCGSDASFTLAAACRARLFRFCSVSVPSREASLSDKEPHAVIVKIANLAGELDCRFLGTCLIFEWPAAQGFFLIHDNDGPPMSIVIVTNADLDIVLLHVPPSYFPLGWTERLEVTRPRLRDRQA
jgi:hypothetical protein